QQAPPPHDSLRGAVRTVDPRARTVAVTTGVGMALRVVQLRVPTELRVSAGGAALPLTALQPGDIVRVSFGWRPAGLVAYTIERHATAFHPGGPGRPCDELAAEGGPVFQKRVTPALHAALNIDSEPVSPHATAIAARTTPVILGFGLLDAVPDSVILSYADPDDRNGD